MEKDFNNAIKEIELNGKEQMQATVIIFSITTTVFTSFYYIITASFMGTSVAITFASLLIIKNFASTLRKIIYAIGSTEEYRIGFIDKLCSLAGIAYLVLFYITFFS
jgi:hypothetical protein